MYTELKLNSAHENVRKLSEMLKDLHYPIANITDTYTENTREVG